MMLLGCVIVPGLEAQQPPDIGQRIRVWVGSEAGRRAVEGAYNGMSGGSLVVGRTVVPVADIHTFEVYKGSRTGRAAKGLLTGLGSGVVLGVLVGAMDDSCYFLACGRAENAAFGATLFGILGAPVGLVIGLVKSSWRDHPVPQSSQSTPLSIQPEFTNGFGFSAKLMLGGG